jgi:hypothetical protein
MQGKSLEHCLDFLNCVHTVTVLLDLYRPCMVLKDLSYCLGTDDLDSIHEQGSENRREDDI